MGSGVGALGEPGVIRKCKLEAAVLNTLMSLILFPPLHLQPSAKLFKGSPHLTLCHLFFIGVVGVWGKGRNYKWGVRPKALLPLAWWGHQNEGGRQKGSRQSQRD